MKKMILTGAGSEQRFLSERESQGESYFLVFNDGELRIPVGADVLQMVIEHMYGADRLAADHEQNEEVRQEEPEDQEEPEEVPYASAFGLGRNGRGPVTDEDGVDQV